QDARAPLALRLPDTTFDERLTVYGETRTVELLTFGGGHTDSDAVLWLPEERILFAADLLFHGSHPWIGDGHPDEWVRILGDLEALEPETVVPGHGPLATVAAFDEQRRYFPVLRAAAEQVMAAGGSAKDAALPDAFSHLEGADGFNRNLGVMIDWLAGS
ncbi:MAG: MBL fold metallo-hydrolase, partial [Anaerolineae bacterium]|nr:MBL fold metallo-hydrolase [Anaerolineae bacterium]